MVRLTIATAALLMVGISSAFAQDPQPTQDQQRSDTPQQQEEPAQAPERSGTAQQQKACSKDVSRHCRSVMKEDDATITGCLREHRSKLSKACLKALAEQK
ncbi:hypothetical protein V1291_005395 [Nitrobacteraceae bacterium AZCC 1564]